ncbi:MAG: ATP-binding cassette domain-containing protein, partial [Candidatus Omnitrophica bacterium]|nr:ATP-binding cassette domain-containing protein [Candidatus Omnitrophota bacterium]
MSDFKIEVYNLNLWYRDFQALKDINLLIKKNLITAIIGPSGCGKSTLLRTFNRMNDLIEGVRVEGRVCIDGEDILGSKTNLLLLRKKVGMVFQKPNPFAISILENLSFPLHIHGIKNKSELEARVEESLKAVSLWEELKDKLKVSADKLSLEQKQRLCIARALIMKPEILLM